MASARKKSLPGTHSGRDKVLSLLGQFMELSDGTFRIDNVGSLMSEGNLSAITLQVFRADRPDLSMSLGGADLLRLQDGLIQEVVVL